MDVPYQLCFSLFLCVLSGCAENNSSTPIASHELDYLGDKARPYDVYDYVRGDVYISEIVSNNVAGLVDDTGDISDWIELHNRGNASVSLLNWKLVYNETIWTFPDVQISPNQYMVVFASGKNKFSGQLHTNFTMSNRDDDYLALRKGPNPEDVVSRHYPLPVNEPDTSYEHFADGVGEGMFAYGVYGFTEIQTPNAAHVDQKLITN